MPFTFRVFYFVENYFTCFSQILFLILYVVEKLNDKIAHLRPRIYFGFPPNSEAVHSPFKKGARGICEEQA